MSLCGGLFSSYLCQDCENFGMDYFILFYLIFYSCTIRLIVQEYSGYSKDFPDTFSSVLICREIMGEHFSFVFTFAIDKPTN